MTISELITRLQEMRSEHGDLPVWTEDEPFTGYEIGKIVFRDELTVLGCVYPNRLVVVPSED